MVSRVVAGLAILLVVGSVSACGKSDGGAGPIQKADLPGRIAALICESVNGCCSNSGLVFDKAGCQAEVGEDLADDLFDDYDSTRVDYDANAAGDCLAAAGAQIHCGRIEGEDLPACDRILVGKVALGQPCNGSEECARVDGKPSYCTGSDEGGPAVCTRRQQSEHGKAGQACSFTCDSDDCGIVVSPAPVGGAPAVDVACYRNEGLYCDGSVCATLVAPGGPCNDSDACRAGSFCDFTSQSCKPLLADGQVCNTDSDCASRDCYGPDATDAPSGPGAAPAPTSAQRCVQITPDSCSESFSSGDDSVDEGSTPSQPPPPSP
jgi:hypothetical protein